MERVGIAPLAVLLELYAFRIVPLVLHGRVVAPLALTARHRHSHPHYFT
jgi:hypothetical protein